MSYPSLNRLLYLLFLPLLALACEKETIQPAQNLPGQSEQRVCRITEIPYGNSIYLPDTILTEYDTLRFVYTDDGKLLTADRYEGGQVTFSYEGNRVAGAVYTVPEYAVEFVGIYSYDDEGLLREVRYPNWYTSPRRGESRLEVDSFFYDDTGRRTGVSTWAQVDDHLFSGYVPVVERSYTYDASGNIPQVIELEYYSTQYEGRQANRRVTTRTGFTVYRSLLFESPLRDHHLYAISPYLHEREEFIVTDPRGNRKSYGTADFVFTPEYIIPEGYYTWSRPYTCFGE